MDYRFNRGHTFTTQVYHGGRLQADHPDHIDFSVSLNPFPLPKAVIESFHSSDPQNYPDPYAGSLIKSLSENLTIPEEELLVVNGISQGIFLLSLSFIEPGDDVLILDPTYGEYEKNCALFGAHIHKFRTIPEEKFVPDIQRLSTMIETIRPKLVWICNPNNPTGSLISQETVLQIADRCALSGSILIVDDAYLQLTDSSDTYRFSHPSIITIHSLTKDFSIAGLRIGYIRAPKQVIDTLRKIQPEWSMNSVALSAARSALECIDQYRDQWRKTRKETMRLTEEMERIGIRTFPTSCNIILSEMRAPLQGEPITSEQFHRRLFEQRITVRDCSSFGYPDLFRIGTRTQEENDRLIQVLGQESLWER